jgi:glycosyltransferase involved in cell wall biosynthesis
LREAQAVLCISETTRRDVLELAGVSDERIFVSPLAPRPEFQPPRDAAQRQAAQAHVKIDGPFFLAISTVEPRKNYPRLIEALAVLRARGLEHRLVIAGRPGWSQAALDECLDRLRMRDHVRLVGYASDAELLAYLWHATALVMPSLYEGFGLPVLEAMACGTPVIAAAAGSLPEIVADAGILVDPLDVESIATGMEQIANDGTLRQRLATAGLERAAQFSWDRTARVTWDAYQAAKG